MQGRGWALALAVTSAGVAVHAPAARAQAAPAAADPARLALGVELARNVVRQDLMTARVDHVFSLDMLGSAPVFQDAEKKYPGIAAAVIEQVRPVARAELIRLIPNLWQSLGSFYAERLTANELNETLVFARSSAGTKFEWVGRRRADAPAPAMTPAEESDTARFFASETGRKVDRLQSEAAPILDAWFDTVMPGGDPVLQKAIGDAVRNFATRGRPK